MVWFWMVPTSMDHLVYTKLFYLPKHSSSDGRAGTLNTVQANPIIWIPDQYLNEVHLITLHYLLNTGHYKNWFLDESEFGFNVCQIITARNFLMPVWSFYNLAYSTHISIDRFFYQVLLPGSFIRFFHQVLLTGSFTRFFYQVLLPSSFTRFFYQVLLPSSFNRFFYQVLLPGSFTKFFHQVLLPSSFTRFF